MLSVSNRSVITDRQSKVKVSWLIPSLPMSMSQSAVVRHGFFSRLSNWSPLLGQRCCGRLLSRTRLMRNHLEAYYSLSEYKLLFDIRNSPTEHFASILYVFLLWSWNSCLKLCVNEKKKRDVAMMMLFFCCCVVTLPTVGSLGNEGSKRSTFLYGIWCYTLTMNRQMLLLIVMAI
jgi:hypothetical protein